MLDRIGSVVHWLGFLTTLLVGYVLFTDTGPSQPFWIKLIFTIVPNTAGWVVAYILGGSRGFLPFGE